MINVLCEDELPNPYRSCLQEMLKTLICSDNDVKQLNIRLRDIQQELQQELYKIESECKPVKPAICEEISDVSKLAKQVAIIDEVKERYNKQVKEITKARDKIIFYAIQCMIAYNDEKRKFRAFHDKTIDYIKKTATLSSDPKVIKKSDNDICNMNRLFADEVARIQCCERELHAFFNLLKQSDPNAYCECQSFKDYDRLASAENNDVVQQYSNDFKRQMGKSLRDAFAQLHMHMPQDPIQFIVLYLMNLERIEDMNKDRQFVLKH